MSDGSSEAETALARFAAVTGEPWVLDRTLPGGRAVVIRNGPGERFVLKWDQEEAAKQRRRAAVEVARRLASEADWPVPVLDAVDEGDWFFVRQELMPGQQLSYLTQVVVDDVVAMVERAGGRAVRDRGRSDWADELVDTLVEMPDGPTQYCDHDHLRRHSDEGRHLIRRIEAIGADLADSRPFTAASDLIHWDLHPGNVLVVDGEVSAVIDLDNAKVGDRRFDLVTFALSSALLPADDGVHEHLLTSVRTATSDELWQASVAHLLLRFSNWAIRNDQGDELRYWLESAGGLLDR